MSESSPTPFIDFLKEQQLVPDISEFAKQQLAQWEEERENAVVGASLEFNPEMTKTENITPVVVTLYVRKVAQSAQAMGDGDDARRLSFKLPKPGEGQPIDPFDLLQRGYAIDGNQAVMEIRAYTESGEEYVSMPDMLRDEQLWIVTYLRERGYLPQFA